MNYTITKAYPFTDDGDELEIQSPTLLFVEMGNTHTGLQCDNHENSAKIQKLCIEVADRMREIHQLNKKL